MQTQLSFLFNQTNQVIFQWDEINLATIWGIVPMLNKIDIFTFQLILLGKTNV